MIGKSAGAHFHKKLLLWKFPQADSSAIPFDFSSIDKGYFEEINIQETFIDYKTREGSVISSSVEKKGSKNHFTYTLKINLIVNNQHVNKKRSISAGEYIQYMSNIKKGTKTLRVKRICLIDNSVYILVDYYPDIDGQPMLGIIQVRKGIQQSVQLPKYMKVYREVTDEKQYMPEIMCKESYYMDEKDKKGTNTHLDSSTTAQSQNKSPRMLQIEEK